MNTIRINEWITVLPSEFGWDGWSGPAVVLQFCPIDRQEVLVEIQGREVWFNVQRLAPPVRS